jgi:tRNA (cmo5U34)-methyltransferase
VAQLAPRPRSVVGAVMGQFHWDPESYLTLMAQEVPDYEVVQDETAAATRGVDTRTILELGTGTGETARRVLAEHPGARLRGIDSSPEMLDVARDALAAFDVELSLQAIEEPLPPGPFELVFSALAVHHLDSAAKQALFGQVADVLGPGGRFVLADVVIPADPADAVTPIDEGYDLPDSVPDQLSWLESAGLHGRVHWARRDLAVIVAERP